MFCEFSRFRLARLHVFYCCNNVLPPKIEQRSRSLKFRHFCLPFDNHNFCPSCREANKGDDPCVTLESPCEIFSGFLEEQMLKIKNRKRYVRKQKADSSKDELDLLGDEDVESFTGSQANLETIYLLLHHILSPYVLNHCHLKLQLNLSLLPQVWLYSKKSSPNSRNPWVLGSTSNCSSKWGFSRLLCLRP